VTISNTLTASTNFSRLFHDYIKHTHRMFDIHGKTCWSQSRRWVFDIVMEKPSEVSRGDGYVW
jgi:hypothetical protein